MVEALQSNLRMISRHLSTSVYVMTLVPISRMECYTVEPDTAISTDDSSYGSSGFSSLQGSRSPIIDVKEPHKEETFETRLGSQFNSYTPSWIVDVMEPSLLLSPNSFSTNRTHEVTAHESPPGLNNSIHKLCGIHQYPDI